MIFRLLGLLLAKPYVKAKDWLESITHKIEEAMDNQDFS